LLKALHAWKRDLVNPTELAEEACEIEIHRLRQPVGKQDQYIAAFGGLTSFEFGCDGQVGVSPLKLSDETLYSLEENLLLFFTGYSRAASSILKEQNDETLVSSKSMLENLHFVKDLGYQSKASLERGNLEEFARLMDLQWQRKRERSSNVSNHCINDWYDYAMANGALGGKLVGAGGGGFLLFYAPDKARLRRAMRDKGLLEVRFRFDFEGTKTLIQS
jgi:D-glycero-alpha-D-manno-heptose-7-phosphate kinase